MKRTPGKRTLLMAAAALAALIVRPARAGLAVAARAAEKPRAVVLARDVEAHLSAVQEVGDPGALLKALDDRLMASRRREDVVAAAAVAGALGGQDARALRDHVASARSRKDPALGARAATALDAWTAAVQKDPAARQGFSALYEKARRRLDKTGSGNLSALFDGGATEPAPASALPVVYDPAKAEASRAIARVDALLRLDPSDDDQRRQGRGDGRQFAQAQQDAAETLGRELQRPLASLNGEASTDFQLSQTLGALTTLVNNLDPKKIDFNPGKLRIAMSRLRLMPLPEERYATSYKKAQEAIQGLVANLKAGHETLLADNDAYYEEQTRMRAVLRELERKLESAQLIASEIEQRIEDPAGGVGPDRAQFLRDEVLYEYLQTIRDLQTQIAVLQQGLMATKLLIDNNRILAGSVRSTLRVVPMALQQGAKIHFGLRRQKEVLTGVQTSNRAGEELIAHNAQSIADQSIQLGKQAVEGTLSPEALKEAFDKLRGALAHISDYRAKALPKVKAEIRKLEQLMQEGERALDVPRLNPPRDGDGGRDS